jgi:hypothetical protein
LIPAFKKIPGSSLTGFLVTQVNPRTWKTMKFIVLSSEIKDWVKNVRIEIGRSGGSIFHKFRVALEGLGLPLDVVVTSCPEVGFERILRRPRSWGALLRGW